MTMDAVAHADAGLGRLPRRVPKSVICVRHHTRSRRGDEVGEQDTGSSPTVAFRAGQSRE